MSKLQIVFTTEEIKNFSKTFMLYNAMIVGIPFLIFWGVKSFAEVTDFVATLLEDGVLTYLWAFVKIYFWFLIALFGGMFLHELIHALTFIIIGRKSFKSIEFGFIEKPFIPYVHCKESISMWAYRFGIVMPGIVLGIIPCLIGLWQGGFFLTLFGFIFISAAAGDFILLKATKGINREKRVRDLPDQMGFKIVD
jgi:hypothetical protein